MCYVRHGACRILIPTTWPANGDRVLENKNVIYSQVEGKQPIGKHPRNTFSLRFGGDRLTILAGETSVGIDDEDLPHRDGIFDLYVLTH